MRYASAMASSAVERANRYVAWLGRHARAVIAGHVALLALSVYLVAFHLPLHADFSHLLPDDAPSVRDLRRLESRIVATDTMLFIVQAPSPELRAVATHELAAEMRKLPRDLVEHVEDDDAEIRAFLRANKFMFVPLADLENMRDALAQRIADAKVRANPLYVDIDDDAAAARTNEAKIEQLRAKQRDAEARIDRSGHVSSDGKSALIEIGLAFGTTDIDRGRELLSRLDTLRAKTAVAHPGVVMGYTGSMVTAVSEHSAISYGIVLSSIVTSALVALVLALYFRSATLLVLLVGTIGIATAATFGAAALTVGHLNAATAFLGAIIAGNGINYGILVIARYLEERRTAEVDAALAKAIAHTLRPTAVASLGAAIAYGSLAATSFKGFADFAAIGAIGMILCWIASYALLPALLLVFGRTTRTYRGDPVVGSALVKLLGFRNSRAVIVTGFAVGVVATLVAVRYIASDPFEYDLKKLRSEATDAVEARRWMKISDKLFGRGIAGRTFFAADRSEQVPQIIAALKARDAGKPAAKQVIGSVASIFDVVPPDQDKKLAVLAQIRTLLDDPGLEALDDSERAELAKLRPPDQISPITTATLPPVIADKPEVTEADHRVGLMVSIHSADRIDEWDGHQLMEFANAVRRLELANGEVVTTSGASVVFADIIDAIERDGPKVTVVAMIGLVVMVLVLVGWNRRAGAVLVATASGTLLMVATCALIGLKVNFLDFIALPITLGLGIDYAINVAHRHDYDQAPDPIATLRTSGSAVFVCSLTTIIGYGSLLASPNLAIRGFGAASLFGEMACVFTALVLVPALLAVGRHEHVAVPQAATALAPTELWRAPMQSRFPTRSQPGAEITDSEFRADTRHRP